MKIKIIIFSEKNFFLEVWKNNFKTFADLFWVKIRICGDILEKIINLSCECPLVHALLQYYIPLQKNPLLLTMILIVLSPKTTFLRFAADQKNIVRFFILNYSE